MLHRSRPTSQRPPATQALVGLVLLGVISGAPSLQVGAQAQASINIARGRPYTLAPPPNYALTADRGDRLQLTDGQYTAGRPLWTRATTVGWADAVPVTIVIDLGAVRPISGVSLSTAAGTAEVEWPRSIFVMVSDDGRRYYLAGDLIAGRDSPDAPAGEYAAVRFGTHGLTTHGRYVAVLIDPTGRYTFSDEIEVHGGDRAWLRTPLTGESTADLNAFFTDAHMRVSMQRRLTADLAVARRHLDAAQLPGETETPLTRRLDDAERAIAALPLRPAATFRAVLPIDDTHASIFSVIGLVRQALRRPALLAGTADRWEPGEPTRLPADTAVPLTIAAMAGETRAGAVDIANSTGQPMTVRLSLSGVTDVQLYEVMWTDTRELIPVADALVPLTPDSASMVIPAGMTRQAWISFTPRETTLTSRGTLDISADGGLRRTIPIELTVLPGRFPARPRLHLGGWDYSDAGQMYGLTPGNRDQLLEQLRRLGVDTPWATNRVMPPGRYGRGGRMTAPPDIAAFDGWVTNWPGAHRYAIFLSVGGALGNIPVGDTRFAAAVGEWMTFWVTHAASLGIRPGQLSLLLVDEPSSPAQNDRIVAWASAIKASQPAVRIWEDPTYRNLADARPSLLDVSDVLAIKRSLIREEGAPFVDVFRQRRAGGQAIDVYGADGPARLLDPYTYYRLQAWVAADLGADSSFFWSFIDDAGTTSWNEYASTGVPYSPFFLSRDGVTSSKHVEAIREGVEDFEYLAMLGDSVAGLSTSNPGHAALADARVLLESAVRRVLDAPGADDMRWTTGKDRTMAGRVRLEIADMLARLAAADGL